MSEFFVRQPGSYEGWFDRTAGSHLAKKLLGETPLDDLRFPATCPFPIFGLDDYVQCESVMRKNIFWGQDGNSDDFLRRGYFQKATDRRKRYSWEAISLRAFHVLNPKPTWAEAYLIAGRSFNLKAYLPALLFPFIFILIGVVLFVATFGLGFYATLHGRDRRRNQRNSSSDPPALPPNRASEAAQDEGPSPAGKVPRVSNETFQQVSLTEGDIARDETLTTRVSEADSPRPEKDTAPVAADPIPEKVPETPSLSGKIIQGILLALLGAFIIVFSSSTYIKGVGTLKHVFTEASYELMFGSLNSDNPFPGVYPFAMSIRNHIDTLMGDRYAGLDLQHKLLNDLEVSLATVLAPVLFTDRQIHKTPYVDWLPKDGDAIGHAVSLRHRTLAGMIFTDKSIFSFEDTYRPHRAMLRNVAQNDEIIYNALNIMSQIYNTTYDHRHPSNNKQLMDFNEPLTVSGVADVVIPRAMETLISVYNGLLEALRGIYSKLGQAKYIYGWLILSAALAFSSSLVFYLIYYYRVPTFEFANAPILVIILITASWFFLVLGSFHLFVIVYSDGCHFFHTSILENDEWERADKTGSVPTRALVAKCLSSTAYGQLTGTDPKRQEIDPLAELGDELAKNLQISFQDKINTLARSFLLVPNPTFENDLVENVLTDPRLHLVVPSLDSMREEPWLYLTRPEIIWASNTPSTISVSLNTTNWATTAALKRQIDGALRNVDLHRRRFHPSVPAVPNWFTRLRPIGSKPEELYRGVSLPPLSALTRFVRVVLKEGPCSEFANNTSTIFRHQPGDILISYTTIWNLDSTWLFSDVSIERRWPDIISLARNPKIKELLECYDLTSRKLVDQNLVRNRVEFITAVYHIILKELIWSRQKLARAPAAFRSVPRHSELCGLGQRCHLFHTFDDLRARRPQVILTDYKRYARDLKKNLNLTLGSGSPVLGMIATSHITRLLPLNRLLESMHTQTRSFDCSNFRDILHNVDEVFCGELARHLFLLWFGSLGIALLLGTLGLWQATQWLRHF